MALSEDDFDHIEQALLPMSEDGPDNQEEGPTHVETIKNGTKKRRTTGPKLDFNLLMGERGFSHLRNNNAQLINSLRGPSNELHDAQRIVELFREWHHLMYPKNTFNDFAKRVEKLCRSKSAKVSSCFFYLRLIWTKF
jgi:hypothetical protein